MSGPQQAGRGVGVAEQKELEKAPRPVEIAETWFRATYSTDDISAVCRVKDGKASGLVYLPPMEPGALQLILQLASGMYRKS